MIKSFGIIGGGVVGKAMARCFMEWGVVRVHDIKQELGTHYVEQVWECEMVFLCVHHEQLEEAVKVACDHKINDKCIVIKSTVPIGTTKELRHKYHLPNLLHSPEFLTARCSITDAQLPARNIIGGLPGPAMDKLQGLYLARFPGVPIYIMSSDESEAVKLFSNGFFAVKVAYWNEVNYLAEKLGLNWEKVMEGILADGRIAHSHTRVPGPDGKYGFGGSCLPENLKMLAQQLLRERVAADITSAAWNRNRYLDQKRNRPLENRLEEVTRHPNHLPRQNDVLQGSLFKGDGDEIADH
jgi:UDPglucose 6-dehydrogenase